MISDDRKSIDSQYKGKKTVAKSEKAAKSCPAMPKQCKARCFSIIYKKYDLLNGQHHH